MQDDPGYLGPISTVRVGVEQAQIGHEMRLVISGVVGTVRRLVVDIGIKFRLYTHGAPSLFRWISASIPNWDNPNSGLPEWLLFFSGVSFRMPKSLRTPRQQLLQSLLVDARKA